MNVLTPIFAAQQFGARAVPAVEERRHGRREPCGKAGRLAYGGLQPGLVTCQLADLSATGARVEVYVQIQEMPGFVTLEFDGNYYAARLVWRRGYELGLAFIADEGWQRPPA